MIYWIKKYFSHPDGHIQALYEVIMIALFSLAPFAITFFVRSAEHKDGVQVPFEEIVGRGQLYLLAYGVFGTIFWLAFLKSDKPRHGARAFLGGVATILILPVIGFLGVDPTFSAMLNSNIVRLGYWFYAILLTINYLLLFYMHIDPPEPSEVLDREAGSMRRQYEELTNGQ